MVCVTLPCRHRSIVDTPEDEVVAASWSMYLSILLDRARYSLPEVISTVDRITWWFYGPPVAA